ncbi:hypothetical protein PL81_16925 [Streptomyces sp. RSD-27]|nr:hypothetical protein PL81_16925 [Streptomyces sp. RSD-27]
MSQIRLMDSDPGRARRTAEALMRALEASGEVVATNMSEPVPNRRGAGARVYLEVLLLEHRSQPGEEEVTLERTDRPQAGPSGGTLPRGRRAIRG